MATFTTGSGQASNMLQSFPGVGGSDIVAVAPYSTSTLRITRFDGPIVEYVSSADNLAYDDSVVPPTLTSGSYDTINIFASDGTTLIASLTGFSAPLTTLYTTGPNDLLAGADTLTGSTKGDLLTGSGGADTIIGGGGGDTLFGDDGDDQLYVSTGAGETSSLDGLAGNDVLMSLSASGVVHMDGGGDWDTAQLDRSNSTANETVSLADPSVQQVLSDGSTLVNVEQIIIYTGSGADTITGGGKDDQIYAGGGDDVISSLDAVESADTLDGGEGTDTLILDRSKSEAAVSLAFDATRYGNVKLLDGTQVNSFERGTILGGFGADTLAGGKFADTLSGGGSADFLSGGGGKDALIGGASIDTLDGGSGDDTLDGGASFDTIDGGTGDDAISGGAGFDRLDGGEGDDILEGGLGIDVLEGSEGEDLANLGTIDLKTGFNFILDADGMPQTLVNDDTLSNIEAIEVILGGFVDNVTGGSGGDKLSGRGGSDALDGLGGNDVLNGGDQDDFLNGGDGGDQLNGGAGVDTAGYVGEQSRIIVNLAQQKYGGAATGDTLISIENIVGTEFVDLVVGDAANNTFQGGGGSDTLIGGTGSDTLWGDAGTDILRGGGAADKLIGGGDADTFAYNDLLESKAGGANDTITDFEVARDKIDLYALGTGAGNAFTFIGAAAFSGVAGELRCSDDGVTTTVSMDVDGDSLADMLIALTGVHFLTGANFIL